MLTIQMRVDGDDYEAIRRAIERRKELRVDGETILPDGEGDMDARLLAEICRGWMEFMDEPRDELRKART
jgi:hypothetical protein